MEIKQITEQNPWWGNKERIAEDEKVIEGSSKKHPVKYDFPEENTLIIGPRQVGKTTYLKLFIKHLIEKGIDPKRILYFSCDMIRDFEEISEIVRFSDQQIDGRKYILLDEVTFVEGWQRSIKYLLDSALGKDKVLYVTGSSSIALKKETFPGRVIKTRNFLPLTFKEFCAVFGSESLRTELTKADFSPAGINQIAKKLTFHFSEIERHFNNYLKCGGFPRSIYEFVENGKIRDETYEIYWKWIVSDIAKAGKSGRTTESVLQGVLKNYGTRYSMNSIAKEMEIGSHVTVRDYLEFLEDLFVARNIFPREPGRETASFRRMRKTYFIDPFLYHVFKKQLTKTETDEKDIPCLIEGIVAEKLIRDHGQVSYYCQHKEVDFYLGDTGIELKWQKNVNKRDFKAQFKNRILLSRTDFEFFEQENLLIIPTPVFLLI